MSSTSKQVDVTLKNSGDRMAVLTKATWTERDRDICHDFSKDILDLDERYARYSYHEGGTLWSYDQYLEDIRQNSGGCFRFYSIPAGHEITLWSYQFPGPSLDIQRWLPSLRDIKIDVQTQQGDQLYDWSWELDGTAMSRGPFQAILQNS